MAEQEEYQEHNIKEDLSNLEQAGNSNFGIRPDQCPEDDQVIRLLV
jgi:hypothetical protein